MAQNGVIFHLLQTLAHLFIEESWPLGKCPSFLLSPFVSSYVSIGLPPSQSDQHTEVPPMYLRCFSSMQCSSCLDSRRLTSSCPSHTSLIAACLLTCCQESSFFFFPSEVYWWGFGCRSDRGFDAGAEAALSLNPLAGVAGMAAEC